MTKKKIIITNKEDFFTFKEMMTAEAFDKTCVVSMAVTAEILAEEAIVNTYFVDSRTLDYSERDLFIKSKGLRC